MKTILVVDDYASVRFYHLALLRQAGFTPLGASSGPEALTLLEHQSVDLMMLDLVMPAMSGQEVLRRVRLLPRYAHLPVLVITSESESAALATLPTDPCCHVLHKPILPEALLQAIRRHAG